MSVVSSAVLLCRSYSSSTLTAAYSSNTFHINCVSYKSIRKQLPRLNELYTYLEWDLRVTEWSQTWRPIRSPKLRQSLSPYAVFHVYTCIVKTAQGDWNRRNSGPPSELQRDWNDTCKQNWCLCGGRHAGHPQSSLTIKHYNTRVFLPYMAAPSSHKFGFTQSYGRQNNILGLHF